jgi:hypothetical protein
MICWKHCNERPASRWKMTLNGSNSMQPIVGAISAIAMSLPIAVEAGQADLGTPRQQYSAILKEYNPASGGLRKATTDLERRRPSSVLLGFRRSLSSLRRNIPRIPSH